MRVLIIEQEKTVAQSLVYFMERSRFEVLLAYSRMEGLSRFKERPCDIVLCSERLPDGMGLEVLKELISVNPGLVSILMTVRNDESLKDEAVKAGVRGYLVKPFDLKQLEEVLSIAECRMGGCGMRIETVKPEKTLCAMPFAPCVEKGGEKE
jgi:DNA-binding response OmpR family regulator